MCFRKHRKLLIVGAMILALCLGAFLLRQNVLKDNQLLALQELDNRAGEYDEQSIVLYDTSKAKAEVLAARYGAKLRITEDGRFATLTLPEGVTIRDIYSQTEHLADIADMAADYHVSTSDVSERLPERPRYSVSDSEYVRQTYLDYLNMGSVWESNTGAGITVAVIDTGIDTDHPEFAGRISANSYNASEDKIVRDYVLEDGTYDWSLIEDEVGHGTSVAGVIAASMNNGGMVGVAPNVELLVIKVECDSSGAFLRTSDLIFGIYYAIEQDVNVVNMSFGSYGANPYEEVLQLAYDSDIVCVAAAGNEATSRLCFPAADEHVIGVGALGEGWSLAGYSNYGENTNLVAPGTVHTARMGGGYGTASGTSFSSPVVAGAVALFLQDAKYATCDEVTEVLYASGYDLGDLGRDFYYGFGALDIQAFVLEERRTITFDMLTDELDDIETVFIEGHTLQEVPEPERLSVVFNGWYYDENCTQEYNYYEDKFYGDITLYAGWCNEDEGIPYIYVTLDDGTVEIRSYTGRRRYITIPDTIEGKTVSSIGDFAFDQERSLRGITLPTGLTHIGWGAFRYCTSLNAILIPERVKEIEPVAFMGNIRLASVAFAGSELTSIGEYAFADCSRLEAIRLPASVTQIDGSAFSGAVSLRSIFVNSGNTAFCSRDGILFNYSGSTLVAFPAAYGTSYTIPAGVIRIGRSAFACAGLTEIDLSDVKTIEESAFSNAALKSVVIPDSVTSWGEQVFFGCASLSQVTLGNGVSYIPAAAFSNCFALREIAIPDCIKVLSKLAFANSGLERVVFGENSALTEIGNEVFANCHIGQIEIPASVITIGSGAFSRNPLTQVNFTEDSALRTIGSSAFANCGMLPHIALPARLETIGEMAFSCSGLEQITIPASVKTLGAGAFSYCSALPDITVETGNAVYHDINGVVYNRNDTELHAYPAGKQTADYAVASSVETIMPWAFAGATHLRSVTLPKPLELISERAFSDCSGLQSLRCVVDGVETEQIPDNVMQLGRYAFAGNISLRAVNFSENSRLVRIGYGAFYSAGLTSFTIPANMRSLGQGAFAGCSQITEIIFQENSKLASISAYMFDGCSSLQQITFLPGSSLTSIQAHGLEGMQQLTRLDLSGTQLDNIDNFAFQFCTNLSELILPDSVENIGRYAFYSCTSMSTLTIPANVEHIGSYAFFRTDNIELYLTADTMPAYLDENWDIGVKAYYIGVTSFGETEEYRYAIMASGGISIVEYKGSASAVDLTAVDLGAPIVSIGGSAFKNSSVTSVVLPDTLTSIQAEAFRGCKLESAAIPASVTFIGRSAFADTTIQSLTFAPGSQLTVLEKQAFQGTKNLSEVVLPGSLRSMGVGAFQESGLTKLTFEPGIALATIPQNAFAYTRLTSVTLPDSVTLVDHNAFIEVATLESLSFGNGEEIKLMSNAFNGTGLKTLTIPANVTYIGEGCFNSLRNLTSFVVHGDNPNYTAVDGLLLSKDQRRLIACPAGKTGSLTVPRNVEQIGIGAFKDSKLSQVLFHEDANILTLGYQAFYQAENLTEIAIPASVVSIDRYAFAYCISLQRVTFAENNNLKGIYEGAFLRDSNLEYIEIPDSIIEISDFAFYGCSKIKEIPISESNSLKGIYDYAFAYTGIEGELVLPETLVDIGEYAFQSTDLACVTIPAAHQKELRIGIGAFEKCDRMEEITVPFLGASYDSEDITWFGYIFGAGSPDVNASYVPESLKSVTIAEGVIRIGSGGFKGLSGLDEIHVPESVSEVWDGAFEGTTAVYRLTGPIMAYSRADEDTVYPYVNSTHFGTGISGSLTLAQGITRIEKESVFRCPGLTDVVLPEGLTYIGENAFSYCTQLKSIAIPEGVYAIDRYAFCGCSELTSVEIPASLETSGYGIFGYCNIQKIYITDLVAWLNVNFASGVASNMQEDVRLYLNGELVEDLIIPEEATKISSYAFYGIDSLKTVTIPDTVTEIGAYAFCECASLTNVEIEGGVTAIGDYAFSYCENLENITLPDSLRTIGKNAFEYCYGLENVALHDGLTELGRNAFYQCENLESISLPDSLTTIGNYAFRGCHVLDNVVLPDGLTDLGAGVFYSCYSLSRITIPEGMETISNSAFDSCIGLKEVSIPDSVTQIGSYAFEGCAGLLKVEIPDSVTTIGERAFRNCASLMEITIGSGVTTINKEAFIGCTSLYQVTNRSSLSLTMGDAGNGYLACYARAITDRDGNTTYRAGYEEFAYMDTEDGFRFLLVDGVYLLVAYVGSEDAVTLPESFEGNPYIISNFTGAKHVTLPETITGIDDYAFYRSGVRTITIPDTVTEIGNFAFYGCYALDNPVIPDSVTSIGFYAFTACGGIETLTIPGSVSRIGDHAFYNCYGLQELVVNGNNLTIGEYAFQWCFALKDVTIGEGVTGIGNYCFERNYDLERVELGSDLQSIGDYAFYYCSALPGITIPENVTSIGAFAFDKCSMLGEAVLEGKPDSIGEKAFPANTELVFVGSGGTYQYIDGILYDKPATRILYVSSSISGDVRIPEGITDIPDSAFADKTEITSITIPASVETIGSSAFSGCSGLRKVYIESMEAWLEISFPTTSANPLNGGAELYLNDTLVENLAIPQGITKIGSSAFYGCTSIRRVTIPGGVTAIGNDAFGNCTGLTDIVIPESVTSIGSKAFYGCIALTEIVIPKDVTSIGDHTFFDCSSLTEIVLPEGLTSIGDYAFYNCRSLTEIVLPEGLTAIGDYTFYDCRSLTEIVLPEGLTFTGNYTFFGCTGLTSVTIPQSITKIGSLFCFACINLGNVELPEGLVSIDRGAFQNTGLTEITIPESVTSIGGSAFYGCDGLETVTIPENVTALQGCTFQGCTNLKSVVLPGGLKSIGRQEFYECSSLSEIAIPEGVTSIGEYAFYQCDSLREVTIPAGVTSIGHSVFTGCDELADVTLTEGLCTIGNYMFSDCTSLQSIMLPQSLTSIGNYAFRDCTGLLAVINNSALELTFGSTDHGYVAYYATSITDQDGNTTYSDGYTPPEEGIIVDDFRFSYQNGRYYLHAYLGTEETITLPENISGESYRLSDFYGARNVILPETITSLGSASFAWGHGMYSIVIPGSVTKIGERTLKNSYVLKKVTIGEGVQIIGDYAFAGSPELKELNIPDSVTFIGADVFAGTQLIVKENDTQSVDGWVCWVDPELTYMVYAGYRGAASDAYENCSQLKNAIWNGTLSGATNVETLILTKLTEEKPTAGTTLKNIVVTGEVDGRAWEKNPSFLQNISNVPIFVEGSEETLRWDDICPGWNHGNRVYYAEKWAWTNFYDVNGRLILSQPRLNSEIIHIPMYEIAPDAQYTYRLEGWDIDGDGQADSIPATSSQDLNARPVVTQAVRNYTVTFRDADTGAVYHSVQVPYGSSVTLPAAPEKTGYTFTGWAGYAADKVIVRDTVFYAQWQHLGEGHVYAEPVWVEPTCTLPGYNKHVCTICGEYYATDEVAALGHSYEESVREPTCTEDGVKVYTCTVCAYSYEDYLQAAAGHTYGEWTVTIAPGCETEGTQSHTCTVCGHREDAFLPAAGHDFHAAQTVESTCTTAGSVVYICEQCGVQSQEILPLAPHAYQKEYTTKASMEQLAATMPDVLWGVEGDSAYYFVCADCGCIQTISESGGSPETESGGCSHSAAVWKTAREATCVDRSVEIRVCEDCDEILEARVVGELAGHSYGEWEEETAPTCTAEGSERRNCANCDHYETYVVAALGHGLIPHDAQEPTCTEAGWHAYETCFRCDYSTYEELPAKGHSYESVVTEPTCTEQGHTTHTCTVCGDSYVDSYTDALGHQPGEAVAENRVEAACEADGYYDSVVYCTVCGWELSREAVTIPATGHSFGAWYTSTEATCADNGVERRDCITCGHSETREIAARGHQYESTVTEPTCTEQGYTTHTCTLCGDSYVDSYTDALGHQPGEAVAENKVEAACETDGYYDSVVYCSVCGQELSRETVTIPATGHSFGAWETTREATCTEPGAKQRSCSVCGKVETEELPAKGHSYESVVTEPTCTEQGYTTHTCTVCGDSYVDSYTDALGHQPGEAVEENRAEAFCEADGFYDSVVYCTGCGQELSRETVTIPATGHSFGVWYTFTEATCTDSGVERRDCIACGHFETRETAARGHQYESAVTEPTCTEQGYTTHTCTVCGDSYVDSYTDALGHQPGETVAENRVDATCETAGYYDSVVYCSVCGEELSRETVTIPATGHSYGAWKTIREATCTEPGTKQRSCSACGKVETEELPAKGHKYESVVTEPTCAEQGYTTYTCTVCGESYVGDYTDPVSHSYENGSCIWCGEEQKTEEYTVKWISGTTSLNGAIDLNLYVALSENLVNDPSVFVRFTHSDVTVDVPMAEGLHAIKNQTDCYRFSCEIYAKQVGDTVTIQVMKGDEPVGTALNYSVMRYCLNQISKSKDPVLLNLCKALLNYGAASQELFNYNTDALANASLSEADKTLADVDASAYKYSVSGTGNGIKARSVTLMLEDVVKIRMYFTLTGGKPIEDYTFTINGEEVTPVQKGNEYYVETDGIAARELDEMFEFKVDGITVRYGALSYVNSKLTSSKTSELEKNISKALYAYYAAAEALLG